MEAIESFRKNDLDFEDLEHFFNVLKRRRSIRRIKDSSIPEEYIARIIAAASLAPSASNSQPWEFIVIKDHETKKKIADIIHIDQEICKSKDFFPHPSPDYMIKAPYAIVVCVDPRLKQAYPGTMIDSEEVFTSSYAAAIENMLLAAAALGLTTVWVSSSPVRDNLLKKLLEIPDPIQSRAIIPVGYPEVKPRQKYERPLNELIHFNKYDMAKYRNNEQITEFMRLSTFRKTPELHEWKRRDQLNSK
ncbi:MAG: nitroreductase family protein [Nitrosopumilaceae archaeon]